MVGSAEKIQLDDEKSGIKFVRPTLIDLNKSSVKISKKTFPGL